MTEEIVTLRNAAGCALYCMLHLPDPAIAKGGAACLLLSPGVKMRVGPHRLYKKLIGEFLSRGIPVLRVDFHGLGDSEGELSEERLDQLYRQVQMGLFVDDTRAAMDFCEGRLGVDRFIVGGLCGGAITGLLAAERDERIVAIYGIGIPVILDGSGEHQAKNMTQGQLTSVRSKYLSKLLQPSSWLRLLTFRTDLRLLAASMFRSGTRRTVSSTRSDSAVPAPSGEVAANLNMNFVRAYFRMLERRVPMLFLFSGADRLLWEWQEKVKEPWAAALERFEQQAQVVVIPGANHILGEPAWVREACRHTRSWLGGTFPADG